MTYGIDQDTLEIIDLNEFERSQKYMYTMDLLKQGLDYDPPSLQDIVKYGKLEDLVLCVKVAAARKQRYTFPNYPIYPTQTVVFDDSEYLVDK